MEHKKNLLSSQIIGRLTLQELEKLSTPELRQLHEAIGISARSKKREDLLSFLTIRIVPQIEQLCQISSSSNFSQSSRNFNDPFSILRRDPIINKIIKNYHNVCHSDRLLNNALPTHFNAPPRILEISQCLCGGSLDSNSIKENQIKCVNLKCQKRFHRYCLKIGNDEKYPLFECPSCVLSKCDPLHEVQETLIPPFLLDNRDKSFSINQKTYSIILNNMNYAVEIRSIKLEDKNHEQCWPNSGELRLNYKKVLEFKPLQQNSSLKKRKDEKFFTNDIDFVKQGINHIELYCKKDISNRKNEETYVAAVYFVKILTAEELVQKIKRESRREMDECIKMIKADFQNSVLDIDMLSYPLTCVFDMQLLKTPAKGSHCKHANCFSLENFISVWQKNHQRKWTCPICKLKSFDIIVDTYFEKIMAEFKEANFGDPISVNVEIRRDASYKFVADDDSIKSENEEKAPVKQKNIPEKSQNFVILDESDEEAEQTTSAPQYDPFATSTEFQIPALNQKTNDQTPNMQIEHEPSPVGSILSLGKNKTPQNNTIELEDDDDPQITSHENENNESSRMIEEPIQSAPQIQTQIPNQNSSSFPIPPFTFFSQEMPIQQQMPQRVQVYPVQQVPTIPSFVSVMEQYNPLLTNINNGVSNQPQMMNGQVQTSANTFDSTPKLALPNNGNKYPSSSQNFQPLMYKNATEFYSTNTFLLNGLQNNVPQNLAMKQGLSLSNIENVKPLPFGLVDVSQNTKKNGTKENHSQKISNIIPGKSPQKDPLFEQSKSTAMSEEKKVYERIPASEDFKKEASEKITNLLEFYDKKLELPTLDNFKTQKFADLNVNKENHLRTSKKLLSVVMKHVPFNKSTNEKTQKKPIQNKANEIINAIQNISTQPSLIETVIKPTIHTYPNTGVQSVVGNWGHELNPICLD